MEAIILCNGTINDYEKMSKYFKNAEIIICADGGARHARNFGIKPDILLGDLDSITKEDLDYFKNMGTIINRFPPQKDLTDGEIAIDAAIKEGSTKITIIGGTGSRLDHTLANVFMLKKMLNMGIEGIIINEQNEMWLINDSIILNREQDSKVSLIPITDKVLGITTTGLYYELKNDALEFGSSRGISNEFVEAVAVVTIKCGLLLVVKSKDQ